MGPRGRQLPGGTQESKKYRQIVKGAGLAHVRRGQIHGDPAGRPGKPQILYRAAHPVRRFLDRTVRQAHDGKLGQPAADIRFRCDGKARQAPHAKAVYFCKHATRSIFSKFSVPF